MPEPSKNIRNLCAALAALLCVALATWTRIHFEAHKTVAANAVAPDASLDALKAELGKLLAQTSAQPQDVAARWKLVEFCQKHGLDTVAMEQLKQILSLAPQDARAPLALAQMYLTQQQNAQAETLYRATVIHFPSEAEAWQGLASALYQQKRYYEAMEAGQLAVKLQPDDPNSNFIYASASLDYAYQFPNPFGYPEPLLRARDIFTKLTAVWPQNGTVCFRLARALGAMRNISGEIKFLQQALILLPANADVAAELIRAQLDAGTFEAARQTAAQALVRHPDNALIYVLMGRVQEMSSSPEAPREAYTCFVKATQLQPNNGSYQEHLGTACLRIQNLEQARQAFERATEITPNRSFAYQQLALTYNRLHNPAMARRAAQQAAAVVFNEQQLKRIQNLSEQHPQDANLHLILADRYRDLKSASAARDQYLLALKLAPHSARASQGLAALSKSLELSAPLPPVPSGGSPRTPSGASLSR